MVHQRLIGRVKTPYMLSALTFAMLSFSSTATAQSTPTELADLALEDLLNFDITEEDSNSSEPIKRWDFSYTYRKLRSGGYRSGTTNFSFDDVLFSLGDVRTPRNYPVVPTYICQDVHAFTVGYALNDKLSVNVLVPYIRQATDHISSVPGFADFLLKSKGVGDIGVSISHQEHLTKSSALQLSLGVRLAVGSINETGDTPRNGTGTLERLPYTMQIGSGTTDFTGAINYSKLVSDFRLGFGTNTTIRTGKNDNGYRLGNNFGTTAWAQYSKNHWLQPGVRVNVRAIQKIHGGDTSLRVPAAIPYPASITDPNNYGGTKAHISALLKVCPKSDCKMSFTGEYGVPIYQNLNGIQPKDRSYISASAALKF